MDIVLQRDVNGEAKTNLVQTVVWHSPDGFEWGYGGSGPADLALNILNAFVTPAEDGLTPIKCFKGQCSQTAARLHQRFKREYIEPIPYEGGTITEAQVRAFLEENNENEQTH